MEFRIPKFIKEKKLTLVLYIKSIKVSIIWLAQKEFIKSAKEKLLLLTNKI